MAKKRSKKDQKILGDNRHVVLHVTKLIAQGIIDPAQKADAIRAEMAVRRRHPGFSEGRIQRRVRIRLSLLGMVRRARNFKMFGGKIAALTESIEDAVIAEVNARNDDGGKDGDE